MISLGKGLHSFLTTSLAYVIALFIKHLFFRLVVTLNKLSFGRCSLLLIIGQSRTLLLTLMTF